MLKSGSIKDEEHDYLYKVVLIGESFNLVFIKAGTNGCVEESLD